MTEPASPIHHAKHESPIRRILVESVLIVISILLALAANQWNESRKQKALTERTLHAVRDEIAGNAVRVRKVLPYHQALEGAARSADSSNRVQSYADFRRAAPVWSGFDAPEYDGTAWQTAITLGAVSNMGFDTVQTLSRLYSLQAKFDQYNSSALPTFDFSDAAMHSTVRRIWVYITTMRSMEDTLLVRYTAAEKLIEPPKK